MDSWQDPVMSPPVKLSLKFKDFPLARAFYLAAVGTLTFLNSSLTEKLALSQMGERGQGWDQPMELSVSGALQLIPID